MVSISLTIDIYNINYKHLVCQVVTTKKLTFSIFFFASSIKRVDESPIIGLYSRGRSRMGKAKIIRLLLVEQGNISEAELARRLVTAGLPTMSPQNFSQKMKRETFSDEELCKIAEVMDAEYFVEHREGFRLKDGKIIEG
jgi:hypothetical protein